MDSPQEIKLRLHKNFRLVINTTQSVKHTRMDICSGKQSCDCGKVNVPCEPEECLCWCHIEVIEDIFPTPSIIPQSLSPMSDLSPIDSIFDSPIEPLTPTELFFYSIKKLQHKTS